MSFHDLLGDDGDKPRKRAVKKDSAPETEAFQLRAEDFAEQLLRAVQGDPSALAQAPGPAARSRRSEPEPSLAAAPASRPSPSRRSSPQGRNASAASGEDYDPLAELLGRQNRPGSASEVLDEEDDDGTAAATEEALLRPPVRRRRLKRGPLLIIVGGTLLLGVGAGILSLLNLFSPKPESAPVTASVSTPAPPATPSSTPSEDPALLPPRPSLPPPSAMNSMLGMSGMSGMLGMSGMSGTVGMSGMSGMLGMSGMSGTVGMSGMSGMAGMSGMVGAPAPVVPPVGEAPAPADLQAALAPHPGEQKGRKDRTATPATPAPVSSQTASAASSQTASAVAGSVAAGSGAPASERAATPPSPRSTGSSGGGAGFYIQVGTFQETANAENLAQRLEKAGFPSLVIDWNDNQQRAWKVVRVGPYRARGEAERQSTAVRKTEKGLSGIVVHVR